MGAIGDIAGGIVALGQDSNGGPRRSVRLGAQGALQGYDQTAGYSLGLNQAYQPAYLQLGSQNLEQMLFGTPASSYDQQIGWGGLRKNGTYKYTANVKQNTPASSGLIDIMGKVAPQIQSLYQQGARSGIENNLGVLNDYMPQAQNYYDTANPELMALRRQMGTDAIQQLALGSRLSPEDAYRISQAVRGSFANRGLGNSNPAQLEEALQLFGGGEALRGQRQSYTGNTANLLQQTSPDYARFILGLGGNPVGDAMQLVTGQQPLSYTGNQYDPYNATAGALSQQGTKYSQWFDQKKVDGAKGIGDGVGSLAAGAFGGGAFSGSGMAKSA